MFELINLQILLTLSGIIIFLWRLLPTKNRLRDASSALRGDLFPHLTIVIPARNEEQVLPKLLSSLQPIQTLGTNIIVVNDQSTDSTSEIARGFNVTVIDTEPKPLDWSGKNWACHQGAKLIESKFKECKYILFTDSDTEFNLHALSDTLAWSIDNKIDLLSARPFHSNPSWWEKLLGPFYLMILFTTNAKSKSPSKDRFFSIGQFLLFQRNIYFQIGGHSRVSNQLAEDLSLAHICMQSGFKYCVAPFNRIYHTRMYATLSDFLRGWHRNFRLGMPRSSLWTFLEIIVAIGSLLTLKTIWIYLFIAISIGYLQRDEGRFHPIGAALYPLSLILFTSISIASLISNIIKKPIQWKSRRYVQ